MNKDSTVSSMQRSNPLRAILWAGLLAGTLDITAAFVHGGLRGQSPGRILHAVASGLLGAESFKGGLPTAILGLALHFLIATGAAAVYYAVSRKLTMLVRRPIVCGLLYGIAVYLFMNCVVLPLSAIPFKINYTPSLVIPGLIIHMLCVGLPIAVTIRRHS